MLLVALLLPVVALAQEVGVVDLDAAVAEFNSKCPVVGTDESFSVYSITNRADSSIVALQIPKVIKGFLPLLTEDTDNAKRMWLRQLSDMCGNDWKQIKKALIAAGRTLVIDFMLDEDVCATSMVIMPDDLKK